MKRVGWQIVAVGVVLAAALRAGAAGASPSSNLLFNPGFEEPAGAGGSMPSDWLDYSTGDHKVTVALDDRRSGRQCVRVEAQSKPNEFQGITQRIPVEPGEKYSFQVYVRNNKQDPMNGTIYGQLAVEWRDKDDNEIAREWSATWDRSLSRGTWRRYEIRRIRAPKGAAVAVIGIHVFEGVSGGQGSFFVDDVAMTTP